MSATGQAVAVALVVALSGCATYSELQQRPADYTAETTKAPQDYAQCLLPKLLDTNAASHIIADGDARVIVVPVGGGSPDAIMMTFNATPQGGATRVEMKHMSSLGGFANQWAQAQSCI